jgi:hypothetical protein
MGLSLQVGVARQVLTRDAARDLVQALSDAAGYRMPFTLRPLPWCHRDEMASSWIAELQSFAGRHGTFPQLAACDAWSTVYVPVRRDVSCVEYGWTDGRARVEGSGPLARELAGILEKRNAEARPRALSFICGSLPLLGEELRSLGAAAGLPLDGAGCEALVAADDPPRQCYGHFMLALRVAERRSHPLWVVK